MKLAEEKLKSQMMEGKKNWKEKRTYRQEYRSHKTLEETGRRIEEVGRANGEKATEAKAFIRKHEEVKATTEHLEGILVELPR